VKPTNTLVDEHGSSNRFLIGLERMTERCASKGRLEEAPAREATGFFRAFAECAQLAREESHLFPGRNEVSSAIRIDAKGIPARPLA
jgi:hypothetical protein